MTLSPGARLEHYEIAGRIGKGGMGEVYRARDTRPQMGGREVAIKVSAAQFSDRFTREAKVIATLNHPNICTLFDVGPNYLVMELVEGPTLAERIKQGPVPLEEALAIARQIGDALDHAHEKPVVHRDLKPGNVKIRTDGTVKVLDFGLAKLGNTPTVQASDESPTLTIGMTEAGVILGTAGYMPPEQARGKPVDKRADIWAFGVVLYEMVTGKRLFQGETVTDTLAAVIEREPDWGRVPARVRQLLKSCLEKEPRKRLRDIGDVWRLLEEATPASGRDHPRRKLVPLVAAGAAVAIAGVLAVVHFSETPPADPAPVRFQIAAPALASGPAFYLALSPDGSKLAYTAFGPDGANHLWVRSMDTLESRMLAGTEGALSPFWSPDSRFIGFGVGNRLKKADAAGTSPPLTLCESPNNVGMGSWSRDGVILFGGRGNGPLRRVAESGGTPTDVTALAGGDTFHTFPVFLPDNRHFLYLRSNSNGETRGIYTASTDVKPAGQPSKRVLANTFGVMYVPPGPSQPGRLLFLRESTLMAQPFDASRLELTGEPVPVAEGVGSAGSGGYFAASTGALAYRTGGGAGRQLTWFDRKGTALGAAGGAGAYDEVAIAPDGNRVAVFQDDGQFDLWLLELARAATTRFTFSPAQDRNQVWSPDGSLLVYNSGGVTSQELYRKAANGAGEPELLFKSPEPKAPQDWSRDGKYLLYLAVAPKTTVDLWVLPDPSAASGERKPVPFLVTPFSEFQARFSPDGKWISYTSNESGVNEIYVRPFAPSANSAAGGGKWMISSGSGYQARWRRDGKEILYLSATGKMMSVEVNTAGGAFQPSVPKPLFDVPIYGGVAAQIPNSRWDLAADGQRFLINTIAPQVAAAPITVLLNWQTPLKK